MFTIRNATSDDAEQIHELHTNSVKALCKDHYSSEQIAGWLKNRTPQGYLPGIERGEMFVSVERERVVGFGHAVPGEVVAVYVAPEWSKQGVGRMLLAEGISRARRGCRGAIRLDATVNAQDFYKKAGFVYLESKVVRRHDVVLPVIVMELRDELRLGTFA
jgi:ribosomal protein S18 acetylase RimI-like enzyme